LRWDLAYIDTRLYGIGDDYRRKRLPVGRVRQSNLWWDMCDLTFLVDKKLFTRVPDDELPLPFLISNRASENAVHKPCNKFECLIRPGGGGNLLVCSVGVSYGNGNLFDTHQAPCRFQENLLRFLLF